MESSELESLAGNEIYLLAANVIESFSRDHLTDLEMPMTKIASGRAAHILRAPDCQLKVRELWNLLGEVEQRLIDELEGHDKFFYIPLLRAQVFELVEPYGVLVSKKFPNLTEDIQEAGKCYACARYTACVFHLMRVMENGVQRLEAVS
jgi:hypothetical protein